MKTKNPYMQEKQELIREYDKNPSKELKDKIEQLEFKSREYTQDQLNALKSKVNSVDQQKEEIIESEYKITRQYKEMIELHRLSKKVTEQIGQAKMELIKEINNNKKPRQDTQLSFNELGEK